MVTAALLFSLPAGASFEITDQPSRLHEYNPPDGHAWAGVIEGPDLLMAGPDALGNGGDYLLINGRAAFVIEELERIDSYYYYGGIIIDAAAIEDGQQANPEQFEEMGFFVGELNGLDPRSIGVRSFKGEKIEVLNDGSDGKAAVIRVHGVDEVFWIVELELMKMAFGMGVPKKMTSPLGLDLFIDYILEPGSAVLRIEFNMKNRDKKPKLLFTGAGGFFGDATINRHYTGSQLKIMDFSIDSGLPWLVSSGGQGAWAFATENHAMGTMNLSGFDAFLDPVQLRRPLLAGPAGQFNDTARIVYFLAVGDSDFNSALEAMNQANPKPLDKNLKLAPFSGVVTDLPTSAPLAGVRLEIETRDRRGAWRFLDGFFSDENGSFGGLIPDLGRDYRLTAFVEGRPSPEPVTFNLESQTHLDLALNPGGTLRYHVVDQNGKGLPARIVLYRDGERARTIFCVHGDGEALVVPADYEVSVTRGFEYIPYDGSIVIEPGQTATLDAVLPHAVNTVGFLSTDMHLHAGPSGDNKITIAERIITVAVEGLEIPVATDHEAIVSWQPGVDETGLGEWVRTVTGEEVTATSPEHINMFPVVPRFDIDARGGPVRWYGLDIAEIYAAIRERGGQIIQLNHARNNCSYMCMIDYDRATGLARLKHPEYLGLPEDGALWSWDLDSYEYQNGNDPVFVDPLQPKASGTFEDWMSFVNLGHRVAAVANTDTHDFGIPGSPRTYFVSPTDRPAEFTDDLLVSAVKQGRLLASTGAFARVSLNGSAGMGDTLVPDGGEVELWVHIESIPQIDVTSFKVFVNCDEVMEVKIEPTEEIVKYDGRLKLKIDRDSQIVVLGFGEKLLPRNFQPFDPKGVPRFTTNPIYVDLGGDGWTPPGYDGCSYARP